MSGFSKVLRHFALEARGQWWFEEAGDATERKWTYTFDARSPLGKLVLFPIV